MRARLAREGMVLERVAAVVSASAATVLVFGALGLTFLNEAGSSAGEVLRDNAVRSVVMIAIAYVGALMLWHSPRNRVSRLFTTTGVLLPLMTFVEEYAAYSYEAAARGLPFASVAAWLSSWIWVPTFGLFGLLLLLWFPTGEVPSRRWRVVQHFDVLLISVVAAFAAFTQDPQSSAPYDNPLAVGAVSRVGEEVFTVIEPLFPIAVILSVASLVARYRGAGYVERLQLKWFLTGSGIFLAYVVLDTAGAIDGWERRIVESVAFSSFPVAVGVAILRYRLYDIDVIINRTLVCSVLTAVLVGIYAVGVLVFRTVLDPLTRDNDLAIAASTLAVAALFGPARRNVQSLIDRRFYRSRYNAQQTLEEFGARLRDQVDLEALSRELHAVVVDTMHPSHAGVWLVQEGPR